MSSASHHARRRPVLPYALGALSLGACLLLSEAAATEPGSGEGSGLRFLIPLLKKTSSEDRQLDYLRGIRQALHGRRHVPEPEGWPAIYLRLRNSPDTEILLHANYLAAVFGDKATTDKLREALRDERKGLDFRLNALEALLHIGDHRLPPILHELLHDPLLRDSAVQALADFSHPETPEAILEIYASLDISRRRDAVNTLATRPKYARKLAVAVRDGQIPPGDLTAFVLEHLTYYRDPAIDALIEKVDPGRNERNLEQEIDRYTERIAEDPNFYTGSDLEQGRVLYARTCQQCHILLGHGGTLGVELTGLNRGELDYVLKHVIEPSATHSLGTELIVIHTRDGRLISGLLREETTRYITIESESRSFTLPRDEVDRVTRTEKSTMPDGLLNRLSEEEIRDLLAYLKSDMRF